MTDYYEIIPGGEADKILSDMRSEFNKSWERMDALTSAHGMRADMVSTAGVVSLGFTPVGPSSEVEDIFIKPKGSSYFFPNLSKPGGVVFQKKINEIKWASKEEISKALGELEPFEKDGMLHYISYALLKDIRYIRVPRGMKVKLPEGLKPIQVVPLP